MSCPVSLDGITSNKGPKPSSIWLVMSLGALDIFCSSSMNPFLSLILSSLGTSDFFIQFFWTFYSLLQSISSLIIGYISDNSKLFSSRQYILLSGFFFSLLTNIGYFIYFYFDIKNIFLLYTLISLPNGTSPPFNS